VEPAVESPEKPQGKGHPTPKRRDAEAARRQRTAPPKDRKEARARERAERTREREEQTAAIKAGDERRFPARDQGPARKIARRYIDGRRGAGEFFWPAVIVALLFLVVPNEAVKAFAMWFLLGYYLLIIIDSFVALTGLNRVLQRTVPDKGDRRGTLPYAFQRSIQSRKRRMPPPTVAVGWSRKARKAEVDPLAP
jgi:hypothetical protein